MMEAKGSGEPYNHDAFATRVRSAVADAVRGQVDAGVDIVCDGEHGKTSFFGYVIERFAGCETVETGSREGPWAASREVLAFPEFNRWYLRGPTAKTAPPNELVCTRPISYNGQDALQTDIENLKVALNHALKDIPTEKVRFHTSYGINIGPRVHVMALKDIVDVLLKVNGGAYSFEAATLRHEHEWRVWESVKLPADLPRTYRPVLTFLCRS